MVLALAIIHACASQVGMAQRVIRLYVQQVVSRVVAMPQITALACWVGMAPHAINQSVPYLVVVTVPVMHLTPVVAKMAGLVLLVPCLIARLDVLMVFVRTLIFASVLRVGRRTPALFLCVIEDAIKALVLCLILVHVTLAGMELNVIPSIVCPLALMVIYIYIYILCVCVCSYFLLLIFLSL